MYNVYRHLNKNGEIIYIGKSKNLLSRQRNHRDNSSWFDNIDKIEYINFNSKIEMDVAELYLINKYTPINNKKDNRGDNVEIVTIDKNWINFDMSELIKMEKNIEIIKNNNVKFFKKPMQLVEGYFTDKDSDETKTLTLFKMKALNIIIEFLHNEINSENYNGQTVFVMDYDRFFNDIDASSCSYDNVYDIREQICDLQNLYIKTNSKIQFTRFSLIPEISVTNEHIKMVISPRLIYSIKNNYCSMTDDDSSTDISYIRLNSEYHHQTKDDIVLKMYDLLVSRSSFNASKIIKYDIEQLINMFGRSSYNTNSRFIDRIIKPIVKGLYDDYGLILYYVCETGRYNRIKSVSFICYIDKSYNGKHKDYDRRNVSKDKNGNFMWSFEPKNKLDILNFNKMKFEKYKLLIEKDLTNIRIKEFDEKIKEEKLQIAIKNAIKMDI